MSEFYRKSKPRKESAPMPYLTLRQECDECGRSRVIGNHSACSKKRQARFRLERK